jgi:hypothetical protein
VIGPANVTVTAGSDTIVYAWGSLSGKTLKLATQTISGLGGNPNGVPAGNAGLVATNRPEPLAPIAVGGAAVLAALAAALVVMRRRLLGARR